MSRLLQALGHIATIVQLGIWIVLGGAVAVATVADLSEGRGRLEVAVYSLTGLMVVASLSLLVWLFFQKSQPISGPAPPSATIFSILLPVGCVLVLAVIALNSSRVMEVAAESAPQPTLQDMVNAAITQGKLRAQPANPVDRSRAFHYELSLSQGRIQLYADVGGPPSIVTAEVDDVWISQECYDRLTMPNSVALNRILRALLPGGITAFPQPSYDRRRVMFKRDFYVSPVEPIRLAVALNDFSWASRVGRETAEVVCSEDGNR